MSGRYFTSHQTEIGEQPTAVDPSLAVSGLGVVGRQWYGVFPLKGKFLNVQEATDQEIQENDDIQKFLKILGMKSETMYASREDLKSLRYGKVVVMAIADQDDAKMMVLNFFHHFWPGSSY
jgi:DNA topoisomerase-2